MKTLIIDLDDTICDTRNLVSQPVRKLVGKESLNPFCEVPEVEKLIRERFKLLEIFPRMRELLDGPEDKILLTYGGNERQQAKIDLLGLEKYFKEIIITQQDKKKEIEYILNKYQLTKEDVIVIGDSLEGEIKAAQEIGCEYWIAKNGELERS